MRSVEEENAGLQRRLAALQAQLADAEKNSTAKLVLLVAQHREETLAELDKAHQEKALVLPPPSLFHSAILFPCFPFLHFHFGIIIYRPIVR